MPSSKSKHDVAGVVSVAQNPAPLSVPASASGDPSMVGEPDDDVDPEELDASPPADVTADASPNDAHAKSALAANATVATATHPLRSRCISRSAGDDLTSSP
jgi:hypothetical protein